MLSELPRTYDDLCCEATWPLSRLYHEHSKLSDMKQLEFEEDVAAFSQDAEAVAQSARSFKPYPGRPKIALPRRSRWRWGRRLRDVLRTRRTRRGEFSPRPVTLQQWGSLLEMACGLTGRVVHPQWSEVTQDLRAWPSGGAMYPVEVYLASRSSAGLDRAFYHYQPESHSLARLNDCPDDRALQAAVYAEGLWENAAGLLVLTGVFGRTQIKYGERGYRFILLDAGHLAQNILLACEDLRLAAVPLGGFHDDAVARWLGLKPQDEAPLYAILVGTMGKSEYRNTKSETTSKHQ